jgi:hypothetical protein
MQHPDLIEKRRKVFADRISQYIKPAAAQQQQSRSNGAFDIDQEGVRQRPVTRHTT